MQTCLGFTDHLDDTFTLRSRRQLPGSWQGRGSYFSTEQMSLYEGSPSWRASLGEIQADFCVPSQTLVASMTAIQLVYSDRDARVVWLARAAPRRWYQFESKGFSVQRAPTLSATSS
eukprot:m.99735 g.99735  ORF g.99735 m.99735 type:complete len:117 (-) comp20636_c0_seq1:129-479(-)